MFQDGTISTRLKRKDDQKFGQKQINLLIVALKEAVMFLQSNSSPAINVSDGTIKNKFKKSKI